MNKSVSSKLIIALGIICIILTASLAGAIMNYTSIINEKDTAIKSKDYEISNLESQIATANSQITENENTISSLNSQLANKDDQTQTLTNQNTQLQTWLDANTTSFNNQVATLQNRVSSLNSQIASLQNQATSDQSTITTLQSQVATSNSQISSLNSTIATLQDQVSDLKEIVNMSRPPLQTLVFHLCEKGEGYEWGRSPNITDVYNQILSLNNETYNVVLLPEYKGNSNWTETLAWLKTNFGGKTGIPIMLDVFGGGTGSSPTPMLNTDDILAAMAVCNVKYLRFSEVISWHLDPPPQPFPTAYVNSTLEFCRANGLKLFWTEWKVNEEVFQRIQNYTKGYEDIVTVSFSTNSGELEPADGFKVVSEMFQHWSGSVQPWYLTTRTGEDLMNMPASLLIQHALSAKDLGAEIIQLEPYWYFFDNGQANENLKLLMIVLTR